MNWLIYLEPGGAPVDELDGALALHDGDGAVDVFGHHVAAVQQTHGHVFTPSRIALIESNH